MTGGRILKLLTNYCENSSLVGFAYIANQKIHLTERLFWLICIIISAGGSYYLIREFQDDFDSNSISLVLEGTRPNDKTHFPTVGICEIVPTENAALTAYLEGCVKYTELQKKWRALLFRNCFKIFEKKGMDYNYDIENYLLRIIFPHIYTLGSIQYYCEKYINCTNNCFQCPINGYNELAIQLKLNCSELLSLCTWNGKPFDCCTYFLPFQTPYGRCYLFNSIHATKRNSPNWFKTEFSWAEGYVELGINVEEAVQINLMNTEDVPTELLQGRKFQLVGPGMQKFIQVRTQNIINDPGVRAVPTEHRKCRFPDEPTDNSVYDYHSYTACISNCVKRMQLKKCKCNTFNYIPNSKDKSPPCDYNGIKCLDHEDMMWPRPNIMKPWDADTINCKCLPSCTEHEIIVFEETLLTGNQKDGRKITITQVVSTEQFRRQAVRTRLDVVVTIGGILGLFMGASVLSGIEIIYFFFVRIFTTRN